MINSVLEKKLVTSVLSIVGKDKVFIVHHLQLLCC